MRLLRRLILLVLISGLMLGAGPALPAGLTAVLPAMAAPVVTVARDDTAPPTYVVQPGDSLARIAARYDTTIDALVTANNLRTTVIQPGQVLVIPGAAAVSVSPIYSRIRGGTAFVQRVTAALDWMKAQDPDAFARVEGYVTKITASTFAHFATARPLPGGGCAVQALARRDMSVEITAALLYHEASHCYQFATEGVLLPKAAELYAYDQQLDFMRRHGFPQEIID
jgi:LysM repeat protein